MENNAIELTPVDRDEAFRYLGYGNSKADDKVLQLFDKCEQNVLMNARPRYTYKVFDIGMKNDGVELKGSSLVLTGDSIREHLKGCTKVVLMAMTLSSDIDKLIRVAQVQSMAEAVITDSIASTAIEQVCNKVEDYIKTEYPNMYQTFRFGVGYGDLPIELQGPFIKVVDAARTIGLNVNSSSMLVPTKSVTAIIGLSETEIKGRARGCQTCNMRERCRFRQKGGHCNG